MRCLVTGASGHLGSFLTRLLVARGEDVTVLVRPSGDLWRLDGVLDRIRVVRGGLHDPNAVADDLRRAAPETAFHLAWSGVTADTRNTPENLILNVTGSLLLFRIVREAGCSCWVGLGSQAEYGPQSQPVYEDLIPRPDSSYGIAKLCLSRMLQSLCDSSRMRFIWLRLLATYGPADDPRHLIPSLIGKLLARERPQLTAGDQRWDYLYVDDAAEAIYRAAMVPTAEGVFNLASGRAETVRWIVEHLRDLIDPALPLGFGEIPGASPSLTGDSTALRRATGWTPATDLETGLRKTVDWHRSKHTS